MVGQGEEVGICSIFEVLSNADELRRGVLGDSARRSGSRASGFEAPNVSSEGSVSGLLAEGNCETGSSDGFFSNDIKGAELDRSSSLLDETNGKLIDSDADDGRRA